MPFIAGLFDSTTLPEPVVGIELVTVVAEAATGICPAVIPEREPDEDEQDVHCVPVQQRGVKEFTFQYDPPGTGVGYTSVSAYPYAPPVAGNRGPVAMALSCVLRLIELPVTTKFLETHGADAQGQIEIFQDVPEGWMVLLSGRLIVNVPDPFIVPFT